MQPSSEHTEIATFHPSRVSALRWRWLELVFLGVTGIIPWATAVTKLVSVFGATAASRLFFTADPVFGFSNSNVMLASGGLELAAVMAVLAPIPVKIKCAIAAYLGVVFLAYRLALYMVGFKGWCACLGDFGKVLFVNSSLQSGVLTAVGLWMVIVGTGLNVVRR